MMNDIEELFRWQKAIDTDDRYFIPKCKPAGQRYVVITSTGKYSSGTIVRLYKDDNSSMPDFQSAFHGTQYCFWHNLKEFNE